MRKVGLIVMVEMVPIVAQLVKFGTLREDGDNKHVHVQVLLDKWEGRPIIQDCAQSFGMNSIYYNRVDSLRLNSEYYKT